MTSTVPHDIDAERAILGAAMLSERAIAIGRELLMAEDFYAPQHGHIWHAVCQLHDDVVRVDRLTVAEKVGDLVPNVVQVLAEFELAAPDVANAGRYATRIAKLAASRRLIALAADVTRAAYEADPEDVIEEALLALGRIEIPAHVGAPSRTLSQFGEAPYDWLIPGLLERGDRLLITGGEGAGKSTLLRQIAVQAASGIHPFKLSKIQPVNVLLVEFENGDRAVARKLHELARRARSFDEPRLRIEVRQSGVDMTSRADQAWLIDRVRANAAELLCIGPIYKMTGSADARRDGQGGEAAALRVTKALDRVRDMGVTLVMETHAPHADGTHRDMRPFGSSVWLRWPEFGFGLAQDLEDDRLFHWRGFRGPRDDNRDWPKTLIRGLRSPEAWPWTVAEAE